jgi:hypothetical protein
VNVAVRRDAALFVERKGEPAEVFGGPLLSIENWVPQTNVQGVELTRASG